MLFILLLLHIIIFVIICIIILFIKEFTLLQVTPSSTSSIKTNLGKSSIPKKNHLSRRIGSSSKSGFRSSTNKSDLDSNTDKLDLGSNTKKTGVISSTNTSRKPNRKRRRRKGKGKEIHYFMIAKNVICYDNSVLLFTIISTSWDSSIYRVVSENNGLYSMMRFKIFLKSSLFYKTL